MDIITSLFSYLQRGDFLYLDLLAAFTNALNGALLCQRPDHYGGGRAYTVIGILVFAVLGGIGGGVTRDVLINDVPGALTNPWYLILVIIAWIIGMRVAWVLSSYSSQTRGATSPLSSNAFEKTPRDSGGSSPRITASALVMGARTWE